MFKHKKREKNAKFSFLHHRTIRYVCLKDPKTYRERIIGRDGTLNLTEQEIVIVCQNTQVLRLSRASISIAELMSHDGFTVQENETGIYI